MGHEIVYCYWCSNRILGADFEKGAAIQIGNHACCPGCLPKVMASLTDKQRETLLGELSKTAAPRPTRNTPRSGTEISSTRTPRVGSPVPAAPSPGKPPLILVAIGGGIVVLLALLFLLRGSDGPQKTVAHEENPPPKPAGNDREKAARDAVQKARDSARSGIDVDLQARLWDEAVAASERTAAHDEATQERALFLARRKDVYAQELTRLIDSVDGILRDDEFKKALDALASARKRHDHPDWTAAIDRKVDDVKKLELSGVPYRAAADGVICIEAEHFYRKVDLGEHAWTPVTAPAGFSGTGAMAALPNNGGGFPANFAATSPRLDYRIQFPQAGKYFLWVRGYADSGTEDSVHLGLDGAETPSATAFTISIKKWAWTRRTMSTANGSIDVAAGIHTLNLWMREDGAIVDRILLTPDPKYVPKDPGPPESSR